MKESGSSMIFINQLMGYFPFSIDRCSEISFHWLSIPVLLAVFHTIGITYIVIVYYIEQERISKLYHINSNKVDRFGNSTLMILTLFCESYHRLINIIQREKVLEIWSKLHVLLKDIYDNGSSSSQTYFEGLLKTQKRKMRIVLYLIAYPCAVFYVCRLTFPSVLKIFSGSTTQASLNFTLCLILLNINTLLTITRTLWFIHVLDLIKIGFMVLQHEENETTVVPIPMHRSLSCRHGRGKIEPYLFLTHYKTLDHLIHIINEKFYVELVISIIYIGVLLLNSCDTLYKYLQAGNSIAILYTTPELIIRTTELFLLCNSATWITNEVNRKYVIQYAFEFSLKTFTLTP